MLREGFREVKIRRYEDRDHAIAIICRPFKKLEMGEGNFCENTTITI